MRIRAAHALVLLLHSGLAVATVGCLVVMQRAIEAEQRLMLQRFDATAALQGFRDGNQLLAGSAQAAATTGNRNQTELYWRELLVARRRERAATELRRLGLIPRERVIWREAHSASDALVRQQQQALVLAERGDRNRAVALLLNPATLQRQQGVRFLSESLQRRLNERFGFDLAEVQQRQRQLWQWMVLLVLLDLLLVFSVLVLFTPRFITQPLVLLNQQLRRRLAGQPAARPHWPERPPKSKTWPLPWRPRKPWSSRLPRPGGWPRNRRGSARRCSGRPRRRIRARVCCAIWAGPWSWGAGPSMASIGRRGCCIRWRAMPWSRCRHRSGRAKGCWGSASVRPSPWSWRCRRRAICPCAVVWARARPPRSGCCPCSVVSRCSRCWSWLC